MSDSERKYTYEEICAAVAALDKAQRDDPIVSAYAMHSFLDGQAEVGEQFRSDGSRLVAWLREAADELENAHAVLDGDDVPRINPSTGRAFTLVARVAFLSDLRYVAGQRSVEC